MLPGIYRAAEYENAIFRLAKELEKTQKLINALEYVIMPQYQSSMTFIKSTLEEREREEFVRLKKVKVVLDRRKEWILMNDEFINDLFEKSKLKIKSEHDNMVNRIKEILETNKSEAIKKIKGLSW